MDWRVVLGCVSLWAGLVLGEVGSFDMCRAYFYQGIMPSGFDVNIHRNAQICQRYNRKFHFATLYDKTNRIPQWSAYILRRCPRLLAFWTKPTCSDVVCPQLWDPYETVEMTTENGSTLTLTQLRSSQAVNEDYEYTSYDRGHLNPYFFQSGDDRTATLTLTNAVPMEPYFNRIRWHKLEKNLKRQLTGNCISEGGTPYLVTGAVPSDSEKIPYNRVSVPSHIWTAVCCDHADNNRKFSFAFLAENQVESKLQIIHVEQLNSELSRFYRTSKQISVFVDNCNAKSQRGQEIVSEIKTALYNTFEILLTDYYSQLLPPGKREKMNEKTIHLMRSKNLDQNKMQMTNIGFLMRFPSLADWSSHFEKIYDQDNLTCLLAPAAGDGKVATASGSLDRVCNLQEQKHLPGSGVSAKGWSCVGQVCGYHGGKAYSWCYTSYKKDWDYCCTDKCTVNRGSNRYQCSRGDGESTKCSPQYSTVTVSGKACRADHPCGLYEESYFWCYTDYRKSWEHCCSPRHYCGKHNYDYQWCYTEDPQESWKRCTP
uniref:Endonuclease domain-containing 1 protein-like n=1 Tax=Pelusios castaneus TaxID=367368 RepID=A0A8C8S4J8_9SAUR